MGPSKPTSAPLPLPPFPQRLVIASSEEQATPICYVLVSKHYFRAHNNWTRLPSFPSGASPVQRCLVAGDTETGITARGVGQPFSLELIPVLATTAGSQATIPFNTGIASNSQYTNLKSRISNRLIRDYQQTGNRGNVDTPTTNHRLTNKQEAAWPNPSSFLEVTKGAPDS